MRPTALGKGGGGGFLSALLGKIKVVLYQKKPIIGILENILVLQNHLSVEKGWSF